MDNGGIAYLQTSEVKNNALFGIPLSDEDRAFIWSVLKHANWPITKPKEIYSAPVNDTYDVSLIKGKVSSALTSNNFGPPNELPLAELPSMNVTHTTVITEGQDANYVGNSTNFTFVNGLGYPIPKEETMNPIKTFTYDITNDPTSGKHHWRTTYQYVWSNDTASIFSGRKITTNSLPNVSVSKTVKHPLSPEQTHIRGANADLALGVGGGLVTLAGLYVAYNQFKKRNKTYKL